jgi:hypothetical protein
MFTPDYIIDSVQNAKKTFVTTFITNEPFKKELIKLVDAQTTFAKGQVKTTLEIAEAFVKNSNSYFYAK